MTIRFFLYVGTAWVFLSLIAGLAWALVGYAWNSKREPIPENDWALYAQATSRTR